MTHEQVKSFVAEMRRSMSAGGPLVVIASQRSDALLVANVVRKRDEIELGSSVLMFMDECRDGLETAGAPFDDDKATDMSGEGAKKTILATQNAAFVQRAFSMRADLATFMLIASRGQEVARAGVLLHEAAQMRPATWPKPAIVVFIVTGDVTEDGKAKILSDTRDVFGRFDQRFIYADTGPGCALSCSQAYRTQFLKDERWLGIAKPPLTALSTEFSVMRIAVSGDGDELWKKLEEGLPSPTWAIKRGGRATSFDYWQRAVDSSTSSEVMSVADRRAQWGREFEQVFKRVVPARGAQNFIVELSCALQKHDVVSAVIPPGFGKTLFAASVVRAVIAHEQDEREQGGGGAEKLSRGAIDREPRAMTKMIQCMPTTATVVSAASFLQECSQELGVQLKGLVHAVVDADGMLNPELDNIEHVMLPAREAERALETGRYKAVILDEYHYNEAALPSCLLTTLNAMNRAPETDALLPATERRRVDKLLILSSSRSAQIVEELARTMNWFCDPIRRWPLSYTHLQIPMGDAQWEERNYAVNRLILPSGGVPTSELEEILSWKIFSVRQGNNFASQDSELREGVTTLKFGYYQRIARSTQALIELFVKEEVRLRDSHGPMVEYEYPTILVFVPTTGVAKQVMNLLKYAPENNVQSRGRAGFYQPYKIVIASRTVGVDDEMVVRNEDEKPQLFTDNDKEEGKPPEVMEWCRKGCVLIIVNGAEAGLTIPDVGAIVESGIEWMPDCYNRNGLATAKFVLSDKELVEQRAGRAGRTRDAHHILCLSATGHAILVNRLAVVLLEKRWKTLKQNGYIRLAASCDAHTAAEITSHGPGWREHAVEARVDGSMEESEVYRASEMRLPLSRMTLRLPPAALAARDKQRNITPAQSAMLRAFIGAGLGLHGLVRVAILSTGMKALAKPSRSNEGSPVGVTAVMNALDIYIRGVTNYPHDSMRLVRPFDGDSLPLTEMHVQLLVASDWKMQGDVPSRDEIFACAAHLDNFWSGHWIDQRWLRADQLLQERVDYGSVNEKGGIMFLYAHLVADEDRKQLWSEMRNIVLSLVDSGELPNTDAIFSFAYNRKVHQRKTDPILTARGRALFNAINTVFSTRFGRTRQSAKSQQERRGKPHAFFNDFSIDRSTVQPSVDRKERKLRAEACWESRALDKWVRFDPSDTLADDKHITCFDPLTEMSLALFANCHGRWRTGLERVSRDAPPRTILSSFKYTQKPWNDRHPINTCDRNIYYLEIETNASCAMYGLRFEFASEHQLTAVSSFRTWLRDSMRAIVSPDGENCDLYDDLALNKVAAIWSLAEQRNPVPAPPFTNASFFT